MVHLVLALVILMTLLEEHQYFMKRSFFHAFLLIEDLVGFKLLNSPFRYAMLWVCLVSLRISRLSDSLCDRKGATSDRCEWRIISHLSGVESVSPSEPGTVWVNTEQMVWSLSKTNTPLVLVFSLQTEKTRPSVMWVIFSLASNSFAPEELGCCFLWPDPYLPSFSFCLHLWSCPLFLLSVQPPSLPPHLICCFPSFIHYRPINLPDGLGTGPGDAGVDSKGVCLHCDLCTTVCSRDQKAAACWLSVDLWSNSGIGDVLLYISIFSGHYCW